MSQSVQFDRCTCGGLLVVQNSTRHKLGKCWRCLDCRKKSVISSQELRLWNQSHREKSNHVEINYRLYFISSENWNGSLERPIWDPRNEKIGFNLLFPQSPMVFAIRRTMINMIQFGLLCDWGKHRICLFAPNLTHSPILVQHSSRFVQDCNFCWYCRECNDYWSVRKYTIMENCNFSFSNLTRLVFYLCNLEQTFTRDAELLGGSRQSVSNYFYKIARELAVYNDSKTVLLRDTVVEFDEFELDHITSSDNHRGRPKKSTTVWGLNLMDRETGRHIMGATQDRTTQVLGTFVMSHVYDNITLYTDKCSSSLSMNYQDIPETTIKHDSVNHSEKFMEEDCHINTVERSHRTYREMILRRFLGVPVSKIPFLVHVLEFFVNETTRINSVKDRFVKLCKALEEVAVIHAKNRSRVNNIYQRYLPTKVGLSSENGITGLTEELIQNLCQIVRPNSNLYQLSKQIIVDSKVNFSYVDSTGQLHGEVWSSKEKVSDGSSSNVKSKYIPWDVTLTFHTINDNESDYDVSNLDSKCSNPGCELYFKSKQPPHEICKHALSLLIQRLEKKNQSKNLSEYLKEYSQTRYKTRIKKSNFSYSSLEVQEDEYYVDHILCEREGKYLVKWEPRMIPNKGVKLYKYGSDLEWIDSESLNEIERGEGVVQHYKNFLETL